MIDSFDTLRLRINKLAYEDAELIFQLLNSPDWLKYIGDRNIRTIDDAVSFIKKTIDNDKMHIWTIIEKKDSKAIGILTFINRDGLDYPDFGFALLPEYYRQGYAFEASRKLLEIINFFKQTPKLLAIALEINKPSILLLEKLGFEFEKQIELNQETLMLYSILF